MCAGPSCTISLERDVVIGLQIQPFSAPVKLNVSYVKVDTAQIDAFFSVGMVFYFVALALPACVYGFAPRGKQSCGRVWCQCFKVQID